jgi:hypothetical protein
MYALPPLPHLRLRASVVAEEPARLPPYKGSMLRGAFGHALRATVCTQGPRQPCRSCSLRPTCVHTRLFETFIEGEPPPFLKGLDTSPRPYVFEPVGQASEERTLEPGDELAFDLLLFGEAAELQGFVLVALERMAVGGLGKHRARFRLERVRWRSGDGAWQDGYCRGERAWQGVPAVALPGPGHSDRGGLTLRFETPTRFKNSGRLSDDFTFRNLAFRMLRRLLELAHFHVPEVEVDWHFRPYLEKANRVRVVRRDLRWWDWERWSQRQRTSMRLGGFLGELEIEGELEPFLPLLAAAEVFHVGKGTTFGLGKVQVVEWSS